MSDGTSAVFGGQAGTELLRMAMPDRIPSVSIMMARVIQINYGTRSLSCVGLYSQKGAGPWTDVPIASTAYSQKEGSNWLPRVAIPTSSLPYDQARIDGDRDVIAIIAFVDQNSSMPVCIGFIAPGTNEISFEEDNVKIERHSSNVYEKISPSGNYDFVFPDRTYFRISDAASLDTPEDLSEKNYYNYSNPWSISYDYDRKIVLGHSSGNKMKIGKSGLSLISYPETGTDSKTGFPIYGSPSSLVLSGNALNISADIFVNGTSIFDVTQSQINNSISSVFNNGNLPSLSGGGGTAATLSISGSILQDGSIGPEKLSVAYATTLYVISSVAGLQLSINALNATLTQSISSAQTSLNTSIQTVQTALNTHTSTAHLQLGTTSTTAAYGNHTHDALNQSGTVTYGTDIKTISSAGLSAGVANSVARTDHVHSISITSLSANPADITIGASTSIGSSTTAFSRADHVHKTPATWIPSAHNHSTITNSTSSNSIFAEEGGAVTLSASTGSSINLNGNVTINGVSIGNVIRSNQTNVSYLLYGTTTNATTSINLTTDGNSSLSVSNHVLINPNQVWSFTVDLVGNAASGQYGAIWRITGVIKRGSLISSVDFVGIPDVESRSDAFMQNAELSLNLEKTSFGSMVISVKGIANTTIQWSATVTIWGAYNNYSSGYSSGFSSAAIQTVAAYTSTSSDYAMYVLKGVSSGLIQSRLTTDGNSASANNVPMMTNGSSWFSTITVSANASGVSAGTWTISGIFKRGNGSLSTSFVGPLREEQITDDLFNDVTIYVSADTNLGGINISTSGVQGTLVSWIAILETIEIT